MMMRPALFALFPLLGCLTVAQAAGAEAPAIATDAATCQSQTLPTKTDALDRMTIEVRIGDRGPFPFVIDTGAERTVISTELALQLGLKPTAGAILHSLSEEAPVRTVLIPNLSVSGAKPQMIDAPTLDRDNLGAPGILGIDTLKDRRVVLDFRKRRMTVTSSEIRDRDASNDDIVVRARSKFGRLVLADAAAEGQKVYVIIDTGAQASIGNPALLARLIAKRRGGATRPIDLISVTGGLVTAQYSLLRRLRIGGVELRDMPIAIADAHIFRKLDLDDQPAILLGMDVLKGFDRVAVDFANRTVRFLTPGGAMRDPGVQSATRNAPRPSS